jgi:hypothetical protein
MIIYHGLSLIFLSILLLIVGLIKPKWILFWMDNPTRLWVQGVCLTLFMLGAVLYGNGLEHKKAYAPKHPIATQTVNDTPVTEPTQSIAPPPPPAQAPTTSANELRP